MMCKSFGCLHFFPFSLHIFFALVFFSKFWVLYYIFLIDLLNECNYRIRHNRLTSDSILLMNRFILIKIRILHANHTPTNPIRKENRIKCGDTINWFVTRNVYSIDKKRRINNFYSVATHQVVIYCARCSTIIWHLYL